MLKVTMARTAARILLALFISALWDNNCVSRLESDVLFWVFTFNQSLVIDWVSLLLAVLAPKNVNPLSVCELTEPRSCQGLHDSHVRRQIEWPTMRNLTGHINSLTIHLRHNHRDVRISNKLLQFVGD